jgi:hypothetical protein
MGGTWGTPAGWDEVCRRAAGRRRYNHGRRFLRNVRRAQLLRWPAVLGPDQPRGLQAALARRLGVSPATVSRDLKAVRDPAHRWPVLGTVPAHLADSEELARYERRG